MVLHITILSITFACLILTSFPSHRTLIQGMNSPSDAKQEKGTNHLDEFAKILDSASPPTSNSPLLSLVDHYGAPTALPDAKIISESAKELKQAMEEIRRSISPTASQDIESLANNLSKVVVLLPEAKAIAISARDMSKLLQDIKNSIPPMPPAQETKSSGENINDSLKAIDEALTEMGVPPPSKNADSSSAFGFKANHAVAVLISIIVSIFHF